MQIFAVQLAAATDDTPAAENLGYSANIYSCELSPKGGDMLVEETLAELEKLHKQEATIHIP